MKKCAVEKSITFQILPCSIKTVNFQKNLSMPIERGYFSGMRAHFSALETRQLQNGMIVTEYRENHTTGVSRPFLSGRC